MSVIDCHIHTDAASADQRGFKDALERAGCSGAIVLSPPPASFFAARGGDASAARLDRVMEWRDETIYPFFWIDPLAATAEAEVDAAVKRGIMGFKVVCDRFFPSDDRAMAVFKHIAAFGKPILFHSGILWDGKVSSKYNHPIEFECLLEIPRLTFALAHISWPWCDDLIALYGKFLNAYAQNQDLSVEMFIDTTPGTPPIYREKALTTLYTIGYDVENNVLFGSDTTAQNYNRKWVTDWIRNDTAILRKLKLGQGAIEKYFSRNVMRFVGLDKGERERHVPLQGV